MFENFTKTCTVSDWFRYLNRIRHVALKRTCFSSFLKLRKYGLDISRVLTIPVTFQFSPCTPSYFLKIYFNFILPLTPGSSKLSLSLRFPNQSAVCNSPLPYTCYMPRASHSSRFYQLNSIWRGVEVIRLLII